MQTKQVTKIRLKWLHFTWYHLT